MKLLTILLNDALQEGSNAQTALIVQKGVFAHALGKQVLDDAALARILAVILANGLDIEVDYNHAAMKGAVSAEDGKAAGWIKPCSLRITPDGLEGVIEWNAAAANMIRAKEYRYLSPVFNGEQASSGEFRVTRLVNVALCNVPNIPQKPLINELSNNPKETPKMDMKKLAQALGLPESATEADCLGAIKALQDAGAAANSVYTALAANDASAAMTRVIELKKPPAHTPQEIDGLKLRLNALETEKGEALIAHAITEGKLTPAQESWAKTYYAQSPEGFRLYLANAAVVVPLGSAASGSPAIAANGFGAMTETDRSVCAALGVSEDVYKKNNGLT